MKKKYNLYKDFFIFIFCCLISVLLFLIKDTNNIKKVRFSISNLFSIIYSPKDIFNKLSSLEEENINLMNNMKIISEKNKVLEQRLRDTKKYFKYDEKLSKLIPNYNFIPGRIIEHSFTGLANFFTINIGLKDGVPIDSKGVINFKGDLIGRTFYINDNNTQVHKITDKNFNVYVTTNRGIKGQFSYINGNNGMMESVSKKHEREIGLGDTIYTSNSSTVFAPNIPVAKIISIKNNAQKHELDIKVKILADINNINNVFIVK